MDNFNFKYQFPLSKTSKNPATFHFTSFFKDNIINKTRQYHGFSSSPLIEQEYQQLAGKNSILKAKAIIKLTSANLKKEYSKKVNCYNNGLKHIFIFSFLIFFNIFYELKYLGPSETNVALLILTCICGSFSFMLIVNIRGQALLDTYGYLAFYLLSMIEAIIFINLFFFKFVNFILVFKKLKTTESCNNRHKCPGYFIYLFVLFMNLVIFMIFMIFIKFIIILFLDSFNILIMRSKTFFQRQIEINENNKGKKIEFNDDNEENMNNSLNHLNSKDVLKTE
jgi:hypothetical protein